LKYKKKNPKPEAAGSNRLMNYMQAKGWLCMKLGGSKFTVGWPDYYCYHPRHGHRWVEMKAPGEKLRDSQIKRFTKMAAAGDKIFVCEDRDHYDRLLRPRDNWRQYKRL